MGHSGNKVHFLGHGIGLAIDEYPVIAKGFGEQLEQSMTLALEPKCGIEGRGMVGKLEEECSTKRFFLAQMLQKNASCFLAI